MIIKIIDIAGAVSVGIIVFGAFACGLAAIVLAIIDLWKERHE